MKKLAILALALLLGTAVQAIYINEEKAKEFIGRCYRVILGREAGGGGYWRVKE